MAEPGCTLLGKATRENGHNIVFGTLCAREREEEHAAIELRTIGQIQEWVTGPNDAWPLEYDFVPDGGAGDGGSDDSDDDGAAPATIGVKRKADDGDDGDDDGDDGDGDDGDDDDATSDGRGDDDAAARARLLSCVDDAAALFPKMFPAVDAAFTARAPHKGKTTSRSARMTYSRKKNTFFTPTPKNAAKGDAALAIFWWILLFDCCVADAYNRADNAARDDAALDARARAMAKPFVEAVLAHNQKSYKTKKDREKLVPEIVARVTRAV